MKSARHEALLQIVRSNRIETQDELTSMLNKAGFEVTQATVSRDIRELKITKSLGDDGRYIYKINDAESDGHRHAIYGDALTRSIRSVDRAGNIVVIKTYPGLANAVAAAIDSRREEDILGCVAGDDTIIVVIRSEDAADFFAADVAASCGL